MLVAELALQSFRDARAGAPLQLRPGHNAVVCDSVRPETITDAWLELLFPGSSPAEGGRGILTFTTRGGQPFRVLRDFQSGMAQVQAFEGSSQKFVPAVEGLANCARAMRTHVGPAPREAVLATFIVKSADVPNASSPTVDTSAAKARLRDLEAKAAAYQRAAQIDSELQELTRRKYAVEDTVKRLAGDQTRMRTAEAEVARYAHTTVLTDSFVGEYSDMQTKEAQRNADLQRIENERLEIERMLRTSEDAPLMQDLRVLGGIAVGIAAVAVGLTLGGSFRWLAFLDVPAFGLAAWALWQNLGLRDEVGTAKKRMTQLEHKKAQTAVRDNESMNRVKELAQMAGLTSLTEVRETIAQRTAAKKALAAAQEAFARAESNPELAKARTDAAEINATIAQYETELGRSGLSGADAEGLAGEIAGLKKLVASGDGDELARAVAPIRYLGSNAAESAMTVSQKASQLVSTFSSGRISRVEIDAEGGVFVTTGGARGKGGALQPLARALVVLAIRAAVLLLLPLAARLPVLIQPITLPMEGGDVVLRSFASALADGGLQVVQLVQSAGHTQGVPHVVTAA